MQSVKQAQFLNITFLSALFAAETAANKFGTAIVQKQQYIGVPIKKCS